jgi:hypothetical protein
MKVTCWIVINASNEKPIIIRKPITIDDLVKRVKMELGDS